MNKKSIFLAGVIGLSLVNMASAVNYVYITGSTAARNSTVQAIADVSGGGVVFDTVSSITYQGNATYYKATYQNITGHLKGDLAGVVTTVKCHWSGSEGGIADLVGGTEQFLTDGAPIDTGSTLPGPFISSTVDLAMADNDKAFSKNPGAAITGAFVGIIPFKWVKEAGSLAGIVNVSDEQLRVLFAGGSKAALLTGNSADTTWVYISGRDSFSGTRVNTLGTCGYGIFSAPYQLKVDSTGAMIDVDGSQTYLSYDAGSLYGYSSGGSVATQMGYSLSQSTSKDLVSGSSLHFSVIAYLGYSDAGTALALPGVVELTYNGVAESTANIQQGLYTFWGNEYLYRKNTVSTQAGTVYGYLANLTTGINGHADGTSFIDQTTMQAGRNGPTSDPAHL
jgi:hypothetical protein